MAKLPFEFIDFKEETFSDYVSRYDIELSSFLSEFEDNTEALFVDYEINNFTYHKDELSEFIKNIDLSSESREEYLQFLKNRVQYFNDKNDNEIELFESDKHKEYSFYYNFLKNRRASVFKILEFLESKKEPITFDKKENENISKSASNDNKKDITSMPWFIVGLLFAENKLEEYIEIKSNRELAFKNGFSAPKIAEKLGNVGFQKYILGAISNYDSDKNIFNSLVKMEKIIKYCNDYKIEICDFFMEKYHKKQQKTK